MSAVPKLTSFDGQTPSRAYENPINPVGLILRGFAEDTEHSVLYLGGEITPVRVYGGGASYNAPNLRSTNGGVTWSNMNADVITWHVSEMAVEPLSSRVYAMMEGGQMVASSSQGLCWDVVSSDLDSPGFVLDPNDPTRFFIGPWGNGVWVSTDGAAHFAAAGLQGKHAPISP